MPQRLLSNCKNCNVKLDEGNFVYTKFSRLNSCRECYNKYKRRVNTANYQKHVAEVKDYFKYDHTKRKYGLDKDDFNSRLELQFNGCAICKLPFSEERKVGVDHDHKTGVTRDLLCYRCNNVLGLVNDNELLLLDILEYLKRHERKSA